MIISRQALAAERSYQCDMDELMSRADIRSVDYSKDRVMSSPVESNLLVNVIEAREARKKVYDQEMHDIGMRLDQISAIYAVVHGMDDEYGQTLRMLYYPKATYRQAAALMGCALATVQRRHDIGLDRLISRISKQYESLFSTFIEK